jgi:CheY-like chemotaxis protein/anti-sigma regulatory factor (Ser/Thr protein kinase)
MGEAVRLQQIVWNLLSNAVKFTPTDGRVEIELRVVGPQVEIVVRDSGEGIAPEFLPYIFERFRQADTSAKRTHGGLGLGLSIVNSLVVMHGGIVRAESDGKGKGATFIVTLPLITDSLRTTALSAVAPGKVQQNGFGDLNPDVLSGLKVLTVDDQPDTRELITLALGRYGAEVRSSDSASTALKMIEDWRPDVVVSDIGLPEMDGYDFMRRLRELEGDGERIPAIAVTGYAGAIDESKALNAGYALHLSKPIELNELAKAIARVSRRV